jgi:NTE family protein
MDGEPRERQRQRQRQRQREEGGMKVLILGGGGTLGAFSAGALKALEEHGFVPDVLIGSSAGGINLLRYLVGGADEAMEFWCSVA